MDFGDILRKLTEERNLSQQQLSTELNIAASTLGNYMRNRREPDYGTIKMIATYFGVSTDYLLGHQSPEIETQLENELLRVFRSLPHDQQVIYIKQGKAFMPQKDKIVK